MNTLLTKIIICIIGTGIALYVFIEKQNDLTELRMSVPALTKELKALQDENERLQYDIDRFASPINLLELSRKPEFGHLKFPYVTEVVILDK